MATNNATNNSGSGGGVASITGNSGGALTGALTLVTTNATVKFVGSGTTETLNFNATSNLGLGSAFPSLSSGTNNTAFGSGALAAVTSGAFNEALGQSALGSVTTSNFNTAVGQAALANLVGGTGSNVAIGNSSGGSLTSGIQNTFLGFEAGDGYSSGAESNNISIGTGGAGHETAGTSNSLIIGQATGTGNYQLNSAFICGIQGITLTGSAVLISSGDQLGVAVSSKKFKLDIRDAGNSTDQVYKLRPVTFLWDKSFSPGLHDAPTTRQVGLIAEEVALVNRDLVGFDKQGAPLNVQYDRLIPMLLNEIQRLDKRVVALEARSK